MASDSAAGPAFRDSASPGGDTGIKALDGSADFDAVVPLDAGLDADMDAGSDSGADSAVDTVDGGGGTEPVCAPDVSYGAPLPVDRTATLVQGGFGFLEGPVWLADSGTLLFSDIEMGGSQVIGPPAKIRRRTPAGGFDVFVASSGSNGLALDVDGSVLAATHDAQTLSKFDPTTGDRNTLALDYMGNAFNSPNDLTVRADGNIYFTDPDWQLGSRNSETGITGVYRISPGGSVSLIDGSLNKPNGIALSPDGNTLYVGSVDATIWAYPLDAAGAAGVRGAFASPGASDGLTVDCAGNLYVTAGGVKVYDPAGIHLGTIDVAEATANVAFGGSDRETLYITARTGLYAIDLLVPGFPY
jgi:gluconolactonase